METIDVTKKEIKFLTNKEPKLYEIVKVYYICKEKTWR